MWVVLVMHVNDYRIKRVLLRENVSCRQIKTIVYLLRANQKPDGLVLSYMSLLMQKSKQANPEGLCICGQQD